MDDSKPTPAVRDRIAELESEWRELDVRLAVEPTPAEQDKMLGRLDDIG